MTTFLRWLVVIAVMIVIVGIAVVSTYYGSGA